MEGWNLLFGKAGPNCDLIIWFGTGGADKTAEEHPWMIDEGLGVVVVVVLGQSRATVRD